MQPTHQQVKDLIELAVTSGIIKKSQGQQYVPVKVAFHPFTSSFEQYTLIENITKAWQKLIFKVSQDENLLKELFKTINCHDPLNCNILKIRNFKKKRENEPWYNFPRCDYMIDELGLPKLIEYNLLAVSMTAHSEHYQELRSLFDTEDRHKYVQNKPTQELVDSIAKLYRQQGLQGIFLFLVQGDQTNICQQRFIELCLLKKGIKSRRITLIQATTKLTRKTSNELYYGRQKVAIAYFRAGYRISDYKQDQNAIWNIREEIELSNAIKIPTVTMELFNCKRVQTELSKEHIFSKYLTEQEGQLLKLSIARQWEFDQMTEQQFQLLLKDIKKNKSGYVLKPNCQGGGNNFFNQQVFQVLSQCDSEERKKYILMEKINTKSYKNYLINGQNFEQVNCDYEVSHYGAIYGKEEKLVLNKTAGFLIRAKPSNINEGGVMSGTGSICSWKISDQSYKKQ